MNPRPVVALLLVLCLAACTLGVELQDFRPAQGPAGIHSTAHLQRKLVPGDELTGELLAVGADGLVLMLDRPLATPDGSVSLVRVPLWMLRRIKLEQMGNYVVKSEGREQDEERLNRLKLVSRYPQGLTERIEAEVLAGIGQDAIYVPFAADSDE